VSARKIEIEREREIKREREREREREIKRSGAFEKILGCSSLVVYVS